MHPIASAEIATLRVHERLAAAERHRAIRQAIGRTPAWEAAAAHEARTFAAALRRAGIRVQAAATGEQV